MSDMSDQNGRGGIFSSIGRLIGLGRSEGTLKESLEEVIGEHEETERDSEFSDDGRSMLMNVLNYDAVRVDDIMVPRADIIGISDKATLQDLADLIAEAAHSRLPIYGNTLDDVTGMIHVKDVVAVLSRGAQMDRLMPLDELMRPVLFIAPSMKAGDLLRRMKASRTHMGIVIDEFGGTDGLITIEDLIEQIVGDIEDEHDDEETPSMHQVAEGEWHVDARLELEEFEAVFDTDLLPDDRDDDIDTVGGLVVSLAGRVPQIGDTVRHEQGFEFTVIDADMRRIQKVSVRVLDAADDAPEDEEN